MSAVAGRAPSHVDGLSDDELVRLARDGFEPAFDTIYLRYRGPLVSYCRRWLDPHRAEEVVQHTFMKAYLCLRDDDRPLLLRPWLYRVAHNAALNAVEKKGSEWEQLDENYDGVPQPPYVAEQRARFLEVVDGIGALPTRQRDALLLNEFEGRCYADIATQLNTSESGVRGLLRRARRQLRDTAALFLPFPALRELVRSDASRLHVDRAGEVLGGAGAIGGAGVAGGLTKVAAGVLAAGTIATGGTAIEHQRDAWRAADDKRAAAKPVEEVALQSVEAVIPTALRAASHAGGDPIPGSPAAATPIMAGADVVSDGGATWRGPGGSVGGIEQHAAAQSEPDVVAPEPEPVIDIPAALEVGPEPREEPAADEEDAPPADPDESEPAKEEEPTEAAREDPDSGEAPREEQASSTPASQAEHEPAANMAGPFEKPKP